MTPLAIILSGADAPRLRSALTLAAAQAARGGDVVIFVDALAVGGLAAPEGPPAGLPAVPDMIDSCFDLGVRITLCQTGMALAGQVPAQLDARYGYGGMIGFLEETTGHQLMLA